jgi:hypothetical protein
MRTIVIYEDLNELGPVLLLHNIEGRGRGTWDSSHRELVSFWYADGPNLGFPAI